MNQNPIYCTHNQQEDSVEYHSYYHTLRKFVLIPGDVQHAALRKKENIASFKHAIGPFLSFLKDSIYSSVHAVYIHSKEVDNLDLQYCHHYSFPCECQSI